MLFHRQDPPRTQARIIILGARGFVGAALHRELERARIPALPLGRDTLDLTEPKSVKDLTHVLRPDDTVVFTSAVTPDRGRDLATCRNNLLMAEHVAAALALQPCAHLIYLSSDAVYGGGFAELNEATPAAPADLYGLMHRTREVALTDAAERSGLGCCILRSCAIYGPGDTHGSYGPNRFVRTALKERTIRLIGQGEEIRDHVFIADVVAVILRIIRRQSTGLLNVIGDQALSFAQLAARIVDLSGWPITVESLPRLAPVLHRSFDPSQLYASFPDYRSTPLATGLQSCLADSAP